MARAAAFVAVAVVAVFVLTSSTTDVGAPAATAAAPRHAEVAARTSAGPRGTPFCAAPPPPAYGDPEAWHARFTANPARYFNRATSEYRAMPSVARAQYEAGLLGPTSPAVVLLDIGGHRGIVTRDLTAAYPMAARMYTVEPMPVTYKLLAARFDELEAAGELAIAGERCLVNIAISAEPAGNVTFYTRAGVGDDTNPSSEASIGVTLEPGESRLVGTVPVTNVDAFLAQRSGASDRCGLAGVDFWGERGAQRGTHGPRTR